MTSPNTTSTAFYTQTPIITNTHPDITTWNDTVHNVGNDSVLTTHGQHTHDPLMTSTVHVMTNITLTNTTLSNAIDIHTSIGSNNVTNIHDVVSFSRTNITYKIDMTTHPIYTTNSSNPTRPTYITNSSTPTHPTYTINSSTPHQTYKTSSGQYTHPTPHQTNSLTPNYSIYTTYPSKSPKPEPMTPIDC